LIWTNCFVWIINTVATTVQILRERKGRKEKEKGKKEKGLFG
jgi:hypothetical protein